MPVDHFSAWDPVHAGAIVDAHISMDGPALPILHALQDRFGYIPREAVPMVAAALNITRAEMHGIVTFYHDFRAAPPGRHILKLCRAEACQANGCESLVDYLARHHGRAPDDEHPALTIETVYCLGNCALGPAGLLDGAPVGRLTENDLDAFIAISGQ